MNYDEILFLVVEDVEVIHARSLDDHGGQAGTRDPGMLASAVNAPRNVYDASLAKMAASYAFSIAENQPFIDGNKRTALATAEQFLDKNGFAVRLEPWEKWYDLMVGIAKKTHSRDDLIAAITDAMGGDPELVP